MVVNLPHRNGQQVQWAYIIHAFIDYLSGSSRWWREIRLLNDEHQSNAYEKIRVWFWYL